MSAFIGRNWAHVRRSAFARVPAFVPTNTALIGLFNNSAGAYLIAVWEFYVNQNSVTPLGYYTTAGALTTLVGAGQAILTGEPAPVGVAYKDDVATPADIAADYYIGGDTYGNTTPSPLAVLNPGWSIVFQPGGSGSSFGGTIYFQWFTPEEI